MIELSALEIEEAVAGTLLGLDSAGASALACTSATTDSREVGPGCLFIAKPGEVTDGHNFLPAAFEQGAFLALVEREVQDAAGKPYPSILVDDVVLAMGRLAAYIVARLRERGGVTVVGITGSAGKTTTKDLLAAIFGAEGKTVAPIGSFNGEVGVPLTVFRAEEDTKYLVIEMGADRVGNIKYLTDMISPDYGVVLKVGTAHAGEFGGVDNIEATKGEMAEGVRLGLGLNIDDYRVRRMLNRASTPVTYFGVEGREAELTRTANPGVSENRITASKLTTTDEGKPAFTLTFPDGQSFEISSQLIGEHHVYNLLAAATVAYQAGIAPDRIAQQLNTAGAASKWRMQRKDRADGVTVINDAYNANPESMTAALQTLAQLGRLPSTNRTWAVLGAMLELGDQTLTEHDRIGQLAVRLNISKLIAVGDIAKPIYNTAHLEGSWGNEATWVANTEEAFELLRGDLEPGDIVLFKSSNGAGLGLLGQKVADYEGNLTHHEGDSGQSQPWLSAGDFVQALNSDSGAQPDAAAKTTDNS
ncbi:UDP-N-acetylmuramoyl-tripeptide--D-alanyl-D-alanine ligase [Rothia sp. SD9660Na]|uniref:UDP-N-acetylmuramoyl-tripeptide--D-alanyl-D- alanine ligase n=1 Tax=Rothia sp. SD9660Na TaxID=3047030 RepID=UPI0024BBEA48|nr:UDP-N-acetylmuramoyl-tripeptide--D-alanyl-D-alanine ligase [Rothia sp. SD9660Na]WHS49777.1 UDP-N-acetylmuramoyl-tripeptide--D-alanyl-D-alanine ligase [Rothia sp. SD9660Na]